MTAPTAQWAEERARGLARRAYHEIPAISPRPVQDVLTEEIAAALVEAQARGMRSEQVRTDVNTAFEEGRAEGERAGREKELEEAAQWIDRYWKTGNVPSGNALRRALRGKP